jgi:hypothetical protein
MEQVFNLGNEVATPIEDIDPYYSNKKVSSTFKFIIPLNLNGYGQW